MQNTNPSAETEEEFLYKIDNHIRLSEKELARLVCEYEVDRKASRDIDRWTRPVRSIVELNGRYFKIKFDEGLTEMQENEYFNQPIEVYCKEYQKTITVKEWLPIKNRTEEKDTLSKDDI